MRRITEAATLVDARDLSRRIELHGDDELASLARSIDDMLGRLDDAFGRQRQFVHDASHELRTPLAIIRTNVDAVLSRRDLDDEQRERAVRTTARAVERMAVLVDDMLASARASEPDEMTPDLALDEIARDELVELEVLAESRGAHLVARTRPVVVTGHEAALRRAIDNLLANAVRHTSPGSEVTVEVGMLDGWAFVAVSDRGSGVPDADKPRLFDRFWRGDGQDANDGHHGLGLSIVRQVVDSHRGAVRVHDRPGGGSSFVVWLPVGADASTAAPDDSPLGLVAGTSLV